MSSIFGAFFLVAATASLPVSTEPDLPPLVPFEESLPAAPPTPAMPPPPTATPVVSAPSNVAAPLPTPAPEPTPVANDVALPTDTAPALPTDTAPALPTDTAPAFATFPPTPYDRANRPTLLGEVDWIDGGAASLDLEVTRLAGQPAVRWGGTLGIGRERWTAGLRIASGGHDSLSLTTGALRGSYTFLSLGAVDLSTGASLIVGAASRPAGAGTEHTAVVGFAPELAAEMRLLPWVHARAAVTWRMMDAWTWGGPSGDELGGLGFVLGLGFGRF